MKLISVSQVVAPMMLLLLGCAQGSTIGEGGSGGEGGTSGQSSTNPNTTNQTSGSLSTGNVTSGTNATTVANGGFTTTVNGTSGNVSTANVSTGNAMTTTSNVASVGPNTVSTNAVASSSSGPVMACNPKNPTPICGASEHCLPDTTQPGTPTCAGPIGGGTQYSECSDTAAAFDCAGPYFCIDTGDTFNFPCCLAWCTSDNDCTGTSTCNLLNAYVGNTQYGICYDGGGGC